MSAERTGQELLVLRRLPGRLTAEGVAILLGAAVHDIQTLTRAGLLRPLGDPAQNSVKYFASSEILELSVNKAWLHKATRAIAKDWQRRNKKATTAQL